ncbi:MAG: methyltransferase domain-containing protein [Planctomycetota bacterium]|nr:methyltransferase domain-containing protein [Planctomycetota bacterium]
MEPVHPADELRADVRARWQSEDAGARYAIRRFRDPRAAMRDPTLVERILDLHGVRPALKPVLDVPCGTGRLRGVLERRGMRYVGADVSPAMLAEAAGGKDAALVLADAERLPFAEDSFDVVVCCRLLHHLQDEDVLESVVRELVRVSSRMVIASFWDSASWHAWRRRVGLRRGEGPRGRRAVSKRVLRRVFDESGAGIVDFHHSFRFVSQQTFAVALKRAPAAERDPAMHRVRERIFDIDLPRAPGNLGPAGS